jgi:hypothetical protein
MDRLDIILPYGNSLLVLRDHDQFAVRLLMVVEGRKTFVTPKLSIPESDLKRLMHTKYIEVSVGELRLSAEPTHLTVHWQVYHMPADNTVWKPMLRQFLECA